MRGTGREEAWRSVDNVTFTARAMKTKMMMTTMETDGAAVCTACVCGWLWVLRRMLDAPSHPLPRPCSNSEANLFFIRAALLLPANDDDDDAEYRIPSTRCAGYAAS